MSKEKSEGPAANTVNEDDLPGLSLALFSRPPKIDFEKVGFGQCSNQSLIVSNPCNKVGKVEILNAKEFTELFTEVNYFEVDPNSKVVLELSSSPAELGPFYRKLIFRINNQFNLNVIGFGTCVRSLESKKSKKKVQKQRKPRLSSECTIDFYGQNSAEATAMSERASVRRSSSFHDLTEFASNLNLTPPFVETDKSLCLDSLSDLKMFKEGFRTPGRIDLSFSKTPKLLLSDETDQRFKRLLTVRNVNLANEALNGSPNLPQMQPAGDLMQLANLASLHEENPLFNSTPRSDLGPKLQATGDETAAINGDVSATETRARNKPTGVALFIPNSPQSSSARSGPRCLKVLNDSVPNGGDDMQYTSNLHSKIRLAKSRRLTYNDPLWYKRQEAALVTWVNHVLAPPMYHYCFEDNTPTVWNFRTYSLEMLFTTLKSQARQLYLASETQYFIEKLNADLNNGKIKALASIYICLDAGARQVIMNLLLSYNPIWLRIGLEATFDQSIALTGLSCKDQLKFFIANKLLDDPSIRKRYEHPYVNRFFKPGHKEEISKHIIRKYLILVHFLDCAKKSRLIEFDPCLFKKDAEVKTSRNMVTEFSQRFLVFETNLIKKLVSYGMSLECVQTPLDDYDFNVKDLENGLRDGICLGRLAEILNKHNITITTAIRCPAPSLLLKVHNIKYALEILANNGLNVSDIHPKQIASGDREQTYDLLWQMVFNLEIKNIVKKHKLGREILFLRRYGCNTGENYHEEIRNTLSENVQGLSYLFVNDEIIISLLYEWAYLVCLIHGIKICNFTSSFADGRALCYIVTYYLPDLLRMDLIREETTFNVDENVSERNYHEQMQQRSKNEQINLTLLHRALYSLGNVPMLIRKAKWGGAIPDQRVTLMFLAFLCSRLLELTAEFSAARLIWSTWKSYKSKLKSDHLTEEKKAVLVLEAHFKACACMMKQRKVSWSISFISNAISSTRSKPRFSSPRIFNIISECVLTYLFYHKLLRISSSVHALSNFFHRSRVSNVTVLKSYFSASVQFRKFANFYRSTLLISYSFPNVKSNNRILLLTEASTELSAVVKSFPRFKYFLSVMRSVSNIIDYVRTWKQHLSILKHFIPVARSVALINGYICTQKRHLSVREHFSSVMRSVTIINNYVRTYKYRLCALKRLLSVMKSVAIISDYVCTCRHYSSILEHFLSVMRSVTTINDHICARRHYLPVHKSSRSVMVCVSVISDYMCTRRRYLFISHKIFGAVSLLSSHCVSVIRYNNGDLLNALNSQLGVSETAPSELTITEHTKYISSVIKSCLMKKEFIIFWEAFSTLMEVMVNECKKRNIKKIKFICDHIQACVPALLRRRDYQRRSQSAVKIQAVYRGWHVRILHKVRTIIPTIPHTETNISVPLSIRNDSAIKALLSENKLGNIHKILSDLDAATSWSRICCEKLAKSGAVSILYELMTHFNRSFHHMLMIECVLSIFLNLARYEDTRAYVLEDSSHIDMLIQLPIKHSRNERIFISVCVILGIISKSDPTISRTVNSNTSLMKRMNTLKQAADKDEAKIKTTKISSKVESSHVRIHPKWDLRPSLVVKTRSQAVQFLTESL